MKATIRKGLESLTVTGPSRVLDEICQEACDAVARKPSRREREAAISRAWLASRRGDMDEMYGQLKAAISSSGRDRVTKEDE